MNYWYWESLLSFTELQKLPTTSFSFLLNAPPSAGKKVLKPKGKSKKVIQKSEQYVPPCELVLRANCTFTVLVKKEVVLAKSPPEQDKQKGGRHFQYWVALSGVRTHASYDTAILNRAG